jgi:hypothetical protein
MPANMDAARQAADGDACASGSPVFDIVFRRLVRHVHGLGPRVVGEVLLRLVPDRGALIRELARYDRYDAGFARAVGAADWLEPRVFVREVRR